MFPASPRLPDRDVPGRAGPGPAAALVRGAQGRAERGPAPVTALSARCEQEKCCICARSSLVRVRRAHGGLGEAPEHRPVEGVSGTRTGRVGGLLPIPGRTPGQTAGLPREEGRETQRPRRKPGTWWLLCADTWNTPADPAQLLFTAPGGKDLCSLFAARPQGTSSLVGGLASSLPPHRAHKPRPRKGKLTLNECPVGRLRTESATPSPLPAAREAPEKEQLGEEVMGWRWSVRGIAAATRRASSQFGTRPVTWCEHRRDRPQGSDGLLGLHEQSVYHPGHSPWQACCMSTRTTENPLSRLWRAQRPAALNSSTPTD